MDDDLTVNRDCLKVHLLGSSDDGFSDTLRGMLSPRIRLTDSHSSKTPNDCQILVAGVPTGDDITVSPDLHTLVIPWAGLPKKTRELLLDFPHLAVHNLHHNAVPTAEMAITLMLTVAKEIVPIDRSFRRNDWTMRWEPSRATVLKNKTALILGYGAIGREIATRCLTMGMTLMGVKRQKEDLDPNGKIELHGGSELHRLLPRADVLFVSLPSTPDTEGLIGKEELRLLPHDAILINIARALIVDEGALFDALKEKRLRAGLDVWYRYPENEASRINTPPSEYPFSELDNVVLTPHLAGHSDETEHLRLEALAELLNLAAAGKPLPNAVDPIRGY